MFANVWNGRRGQRVPNVKIVKFHDHIWNHNEKFIQISTNMPGIGSFIREIAVEILET